MIIFFSIAQVYYSRYALQTDKVSWNVKMRTPLNTSDGSAAQNQKTNFKALERHVNEVHQEVTVDYDNQEQVLSVPVDS